MHFTTRTSVVMQRFARFLTNLSNLGILQNMCYLRMADIESIMTVSEKCYNLLNNNCYYHIIGDVIIKLLVEL